MAKAHDDESPSSWTEAIMTRVSPRAKRAFEDKLSSLQGISQAAYVRRLIYKDLGLIKEA